MALTSCYESRYAQPIKFCPQILALNTQVQSFTKSIALSCFMIYYSPLAPVAQLDRATPS